MLDLFCGAGGFSEGFRAAGFRIVAGIENWKPAVDTFNCNFRLCIEPTDILHFEKRPDRIEELPDTDVIIGSPPCVSFSFSNRLGGADKTMGVRLIRVFLSIVAVKKWKRGSRLAAWYMENVPNALNSLRGFYSFRSLGLSEWSRSNGIDPSATALSITANAQVLDAVDFGVPQVRKRLFVSEICKPMRNRATSSGKTKRSKKAVRSLGAVLSGLPPPTSQHSTHDIRDPIYHGITIRLNELTDHFYETGVYEIYWRDSRHLKINHPYMGAMSFPERLDKPSRTIMATPFPRSREGLLYKSEWGRVGNGEYRGPTVRESATLMSFPITYQFMGGEREKWQLIGNAVCPLVASSLAMELRKQLGVRARHALRKNLPNDMPSFRNLNTFAPAAFDNAPHRRRMSRFRRHPFKSAGMTITLANFRLEKRASADGTWRCYVTYGIGSGYRVQAIDQARLAKVRDLVESSLPSGRQFIHHVTNGFASRVAPGPILQQLYEQNVEMNGYANPLSLIEETRNIVWQFVPTDEHVHIGAKVLLRKSVPKRQLYALFAIGHIAHIAESKRRTRA